MSQEQDTCDVVVIGAGPAGATAAMVLARGGLKVIVLEKTRFPRFHIGESFLPRTFRLIQDLGLEPALRQIAHVPKFGAEFITADGLHNIRFDFAEGFSPTDEAFNIERASFDAMLLDQAKLSGAEVREGIAATNILSMEDGRVLLRCDERTIRAKYLIDASGQGTVVGRHLGSRQNAAEPHLHKAAYFNHFYDVWRSPGREGGDPLIVMLDEGWFWMIPLDEQRTSVGLVMDADISRKVQRTEGIAAERMLAWGIARCPAVRDRMVSAVGPETNYVAADFSYRCRPYAGPGYFLVGDAAAFMDPIFSTGVCVAMTGAEAAAKQIMDVLAGRTTPRRAAAAHIALLEGSTTVLFKIIRQYYDPSFRDLFLNGRGPFQMHRAVIGVLAGNVFPLPWALRWRMMLFDLCVGLNRWLPLVPRKQRFSLVNSVAAEPIAAGK